ncbi:MAG TPA: hypothetical protein GXX47_08555 [Firmicutes bacterium]|nr:hypothetical protein [Bacillota bacterium]
MYRLSKLGMAWLVSLSLFLLGSVGQAFPTLPDTGIPKLWQRVGKTHAQFLVNCNENLTYIEFGDLKDSSYQALARDLAGSGWRNIREEADIDHRKILEDLAHMGLGEQEAIALASSLQLEQVRILTAQSGRWQASIYVDTAEYDPAFPWVSYLAICKHDASLRPMQLNLVPPRQFTVPGSQLVVSAVGKLDGNPVEIYGFVTASPLEAVVAHFQRWSPHWIIVSGGIYGDIYGAYGYNPSEAMFLLVLPQEGQNMVHYGCGRLYLEREERH